MGPLVGRKALVTKIGHDHLDTVIVDVGSSDPEKLLDELKY